MSITIKEIKKNRYLVLKVRESQDHYKKTLFQWGTKRDYEEDNSLNKFLSKSEIVGDDFSLTINVLLIEHLSNPQIHTIQALQSFFLNIGSIGSLLVRRHWLNNTDVLSESFLIQLVGSC